MNEMGKISEAILDKVKKEAQQIIMEAEEKAWKETEEAERQMERRFEEEKRKIIEETEMEAARILSEASIKARQELSKIKAEIFDRIINKVKTSLPGTLSNETSFLDLAREAIAGLGVDKVRLYVSPKDVSTVPEFLTRDKELASKVTEIKEFDCNGGVIVESIDGKVRIDNSYDIRLEMLLPRMLPEIDKKIFEVS